MWSLFRFLIMVFLSTAIWIAMGLGVGSVFGFFARRLEKVYSSSQV